MYKCGPNNGDCSDVNRRSISECTSFTGSSYLFHRLSADNIDTERKRQDAAIEKLQKAQIEWVHKHQQ